LGAALEGAPGELRRLEGAGGVELPEIADAIADPPGDRAPRAAGGAVAAGRIDHEDDAARHGLTPAPEAGHHGDTAAHGQGASRRQAATTSGVPSLGWARIVVSIP